MFKWYVENEMCEVVSQGETNNYTEALIECGKVCQLNPNTSVGKPGYTSRIYEGRKLIHIKREN